MALSTPTPPARPENISIYSGPSINFGNLCGTAQTAILIGNMPKLDAHFVNDAIAHARHQLRTEWGAEIDQIDDRNILIHYFDSQRRRIQSSSRVVEVADDFACPSALEMGWQALQRKVRNGDDLGPHLSTSHDTLFNRDGLLNEWGVHHFHLGTNPHPKKPYYVERAGPLVFALVDDRIFYAINVYNHSEWEEISIVESLHRNWPDAIRKYRLQGVAPEQLTGTERRNLRRYNGQAAVATSDGTMYGAIGGGVSAGGTSMNAVIHADQITIFLQGLQAGLEAKLDELVPILEQRGYAGEPDVKAELRISEDGYQALFPLYGVVANIEIPANDRLQ